MSSLRVLSGLRSIKAITFSTVVGMNCTDAEHGGCAIFFLKQCLHALYSCSDI